MNSQGWQGFCGLSGNFPTFSHWLTLLFPWLLPIEIIVKPLKVGGGGSFSYRWGNRGLKWPAQVCFLSAPTQPRIARKGGSTGRLYLGHTQSWEEECQGLGLMGAAGKRWGGLETLGALGAKNRYAGEVARIQESNVAKPAAGNEPPHQPHQQVEIPVGLLLFALSVPRPFLWTWWDLAGTEAMMVLLSP